MSSPGTFRWVYVTGNLVLGGGDQILWTHARALQTTRHRMVLFSLDRISPEGSLLHELESLGVEIPTAAETWLFPMLLCFLGLSAQLKTGLATSWLVGKQLAKLLAGRTLRLLTVAHTNAVVLRWGWLNRIYCIAPGRLRAMLARSVVFSDCTAAGVVCERFRAHYRDCRASSAQKELRLRARLLPFRVWFYIQFHKVSGIHVLHAAACQALGRAVHAFKVPSLYTEILTPLSYQAWAPEVGAILPGYSEIIVPANTIARHMREGFSLKNPFRIIPFSVHVEPPIEATQYHPERSHYGVIARLSEEKCQASLLKAAVSIRKRCPHARLLLAGDGPERPALQSLAEELGLADHVEFLGAFRPPQLSAIMELYDVVVLPSRVEGMPHVLLEAMAYGKPIVATPVGAVPELVVEGVNGFLAPVGDVEVIADRVARLLQDAELRQKLGRNGRELYERRFDDAVVLQKIRELCDDWSQSPGKLDAASSLGVPTSR